MLKLCLPISDLFENNITMLRSFIDGFDVLELKFPKDYPLLPKEKEKILHISKGIIEHDFVNFIQRAKIFEYMERQNINHFSFDLGPACEYSTFILPLSRILKKNELFKIAEKRINFIRRNFRGNLSVENLNYYRTGLFEHICSPSFITEFTERFDLKFLLDFAHAQITAYNLKCKLNEYLYALPLARVNEIHISRPFINHFLAVDAHGAPNEKDFSLLEEVLSLIDQSHDVYIGIEYYKEIKHLIGAYKRLNSLLKIKKISIKRH